MYKIQDGIMISSTSRIARFKSQEHFEKYKHLLPKIFAKEIDPRSIGCQYDEKYGNLGLIQGLETLCLLLIENPNCQGFGSARIGVGDGTTPPSSGQTGLQGANKAYAGMDPGYPMVDPPAGVLFEASFGENDANFDWQEWVVENGEDRVPGSGYGRKHLNRKVEYRGTKNGGVWVLQVRIQFG